MPKKDDSQMQMVMEKTGKPDMEMTIAYYPYPMHLFGILVIAALVVQIFLQSKMLQELRKRKK